MSSSSECASRRPSQHVSPEEEEGDKQAETRRISKYDIYGTTTKPFGESYRRSLLQQEQKEDQDSGNGQEKEDSSVDTDSVEETMGCSESRMEVAFNRETVKGIFNNTDNNDAKQTMSEIKIAPEKHTDMNGVDTNKENTNVYSTLKLQTLSDYELIYGSDTTAKTNNNTGYSTTDIYSEVKKPEKINKENAQINQANNQTPREKLMQQIRDRKDDAKQKKETAYCVVTKVDKNSDQHKTKSEKEEENTAMNGTKKEDKIVNTIVTSAPVSFVEEEYSYEPDKKEATSKLVVRSRSLLNLDQNQFNYNSTLSCTLKRPNTLKITTKPDGTIRYGLRQECDIETEDSDECPPQKSEIKNNYVNSIKNAFDAVNESHTQNKTSKAEAFDGLRQYFHDNKHGLQELLINNNVVIIEPFRPDPPRSPGDKSDSCSQRTCRITGATIKSPVSEQKKILTISNTLPRRHTKSRQNTRQGFYHPIKVNKELIDAELPDPDKVKTTRELFENVVRSKCTSDIPSKKPPCKSMFNTISGNRRIIPEVKVVKNGKTTSDKRRQGHFMIEQVTRDETRRYPLQRRWTDSGSLSSGVSSDFSCDHDCEFHHQDSGSSQDILAEYSSDDDDMEYIYPYDDDERHPVSPEVLKKIRACGTTVTYYGGKVIARSHGQVRSPMTMTIMDEIRQNGESNDGRNNYETDGEEPYLGVKFRLVKSNSCGSRLEIAGTEDDSGNKVTSAKHESFRGESIPEEVTEITEEDINIRNKEAEEYSPVSMDDEEDKVEADRYVTNVEVNTTNVTRNPQVMTWAELKLKEARKQWHCTPEAVRLPPQDMEFETFEVLDDSKAHNLEKNETGRG